MNTISTLILPELYLTTRALKMNIAEHKLNLIRQIDALPEASLIELEHIISQLRVNQKAIVKRQFGCMQGLVVSIADDFDAPLDDFKDYS